MLQPVLSETSAGAQPAPRRLTGRELADLCRCRDPMAQVLLAADLVNGEISVTHLTPEQAVALLRGCVTGHERATAAKLAKLAGVEYPMAHRRTANMKLRTANTEQTNE
jgi:hypothetical protein